MRKSQLGGMGEKNLPVEGTVHAGLGFPSEGQREGQHAWMWRDGGGRRKEVGVVGRTPSYQIMVKEFEFDPESNGKCGKALNRTVIRPDLYFANSTLAVVWGMDWRQGETEAWW